MYRGPKEKKERALGTRLQLKGERSASPKSAVLRKPYPPGMHGHRRRVKGPSDFGRQIKEKQKCKLSYGLNERSLRRIFEDAFHMSGSTAVRLIELLESRLDNTVFHLGFAPSRAMARQLVVQGHIRVNGRKVISPGYVVKVNDLISIRPESASKGPFKDLRQSLAKYEAPAWLKLDLEKLEGMVVAMPAELSAPFEVNALVESFSK